MAVEFRLPDVGEGLTEVTVLAWSVAVGDMVALDGPLVEIETDKATMEMPSPAAGVLLHQGAGPGEVLAVGAILAVIGEPGEEWGPTPTDQPAAEAARPIVGTLEGGTGLTLGRAPSKPAMVQALPAVRRRARQLGVDLSQLAGSGAAGRVTMADVEAAAGELDGGVEGDVEVVEFTPTRAAIARHMERSWREIPHVTTFGQAAAVHLLATRRRLLEGAEGPLPLEALLVRAVLEPLRTHPEFNASVAPGRLLLRRRHHIGVAIDAPAGLVVGVVRDAADLSLTELADAIVRLSKRARSHTLTPDDVTGATFTISNIGAVGGGYGTPIIPAGTTAILSVGRAEPRPVVRAGNLVGELTMPLSLSYDHRVIDGALGRRFLAAVIDQLESGRFTAG